MESEIERYYAKVTLGDLACVHSYDFDFGDVYRFCAVQKNKDCRIYTRYGCFWAINGEKCDPRWGGRLHNLAVPTLSIVDKAEAAAKNMAYFGGDRLSELAAARAILEGRWTSMPDTLIPPIPTIEQAQAEVDAALTYWSAIDLQVHEPGASARIRREASERLAAAMAALDKSKVSTNSQVIKKNYFANAAFSGGSFSYRTTYGSLLYSRLSGQEARDDRSILKEIRHKSRKSTESVKKNP